LRVLGLIGLLIPLLILGGIVAVIVVAVNRTRRKSDAEGISVSPKDVFIYLLTAATLYISATGVLILLWSLAEYWFPDPYRTFGSRSDGGAVRIGVAMAIVAFPVFVYLTLLVRRKIRSGEIDPASSLRTGFIYFNLFVVAVTALITLMVTVDAFLGGDLTTRFLVRAGGVLLIAGLVYLYYRSELEAAPRNPELVANASEPEVSQ
jgi:hypothetical protein